MTTTIIEKPKIRIGTLKQIGVNGAVYQIISHETDILSRRLDPDIRPAVGSRVTVGQAKKGGSGELSTVERATKLVNHQL